MRHSSGWKLLAIFAVLFLSVLWGISKGTVDIPLSELFLEPNRKILYLRLFRILLSMLVGSGLAVSGIALQALLRNPLAEPYLLGTSSGAGLGAVAGVLMGVTSLYLPAAAFIGAIISVFVVYTIARHGNKIPVQSLILSGAIVSIALSAAIVFLISTSAHEALYGIMWWLWGSLEVYDLKLLFTVSAIVIAGIATIFVFSQDLNAISIGEEEATHLGINTETVKKLLLAVTSLVTASLVCISGVIGFVGLVIPHIMRFLVGPDHKVLIPSSCIGAAIFMISCDTLGRSLISPLEIPIGVMTAMIGAPIFIVILKTRQKVR